MDESGKTGNWTDRVFKVSESKSCRHKRRRLDGCQCGNGTTGFDKKCSADSFDGRTLADDFAEKLIAERTFAKNDASARQFYEWCQGDDWEKVVDLDTKALMECAERKLPLFQKSLDHLKVPVLFLGSLEDSMVRSNLAEEYEQMKRQVQNGHVYFFPTGGHPAIASNAEAAARIIA